jgi:hypothetical protein
MGPCETAEHFELGVEQVIAMPSISDAVINDKLLQDFNRLIAMERQVLTVAVDNLAILLEAVFHSAA